ncbi:MAG: phage minor head protein [Petrotogales bacterium]
MPTYKKTSTLLKEELKLYRKLRKLIRNKNKEIMSNLEEKGRIPSSDSELKALVQPLKDAIEEYSEIIIEGTEQAVERGIRRTVNDLKKQGVKRVEKVKLPESLLGLINSFSPVIAEYLKENVFQASQRTIERLTGNIMGNLKKSYEAGFGYDKAAQQLKEVFTNMETYELERVARTEIAGKENLGMFMSEQELDVEYHQWATARDERVRDSHADMEGEIVRVGEPFSNGMLYPMDFGSGADLSSLINCRCAVQPFVMPEGYMAPAGQPYFREGDLVPISK